MFDEEKNIINVDEIENENEDVQLVVDKKIKISHDTTFEDCNIIIDISKGGRINSKKSKIKFIDTKIIFVGSCNECVIEVIDGSISLEDCSITQIEAKSKDYTVFVSVSGTGNVNVDGLEIKNIQGTFLQSVGMNVYLENCKVNDLSGVMCETTKPEDYNIMAPSAKFRNITFDKCDFPQNINFDDVKHVVDLTWHTEAPSIIYTFELIDTVVEKCSFNSCKTRCICIMNINLANPSTIKQCSFKKCSNKVKKSYKTEDAVCKENEAYSVYLRKTEVNMEKCKFVNSWGVYSHSQYSRANFSDCVFEKCVGYSSCEKYGILSIFNEVDEPCINISNCEFAECKSNEADDNSGIITVSAGMPERKQFGTVIISNCKFNNCDADYNISGTEKQDGFFGKTIVLYKEV